MQQCYQRKQFEWESDPVKLRFVLETINMDERENSSKNTLIWTVSRNHAAAIGKIEPAWTRFSVIIQKEPSKAVIIGFIPAPPTQKNVSEKIINRAMSCESELQSRTKFMKQCQEIKKKKKLDRMRKL